MIIVYPYQPCKQFKSDDVEKKLKMRCKESEQFQSAVEEAATTFAEIGLMIADVFCACFFLIAPALVAGVVAGHPRGLLHVL